MGGHSQYQLSLFPPVEGKITLASVTGLTRRAVVLVVREVGLGSVKTKSVTQTSMRPNSWRPCSPRALLTLGSPLSTPRRCMGELFREQLHAQLHQWSRCMK